MRKYYDVDRSQKIAALIKEYIFEQGLSVGEQLPSVRFFSNIYSASTNVVVNALSYLNSEGIVQTKARYGSFVANDAISILKTISWREFAKKSVYKPSCKEYASMVENIETDYDLNHSLPVLSDGIAFDLIHHATERLFANTDAMESLEKFNISGLYELKKELSALMSRYGVNAEPEQFLICAHTREAIVIVATLMMRRGMTVIHEVPGVMGTYKYINSLGVRLQSVGLDDEGAIEYDFAKIAGKKTDGIFITEPSLSMPTGTTASLNRKKKLLKACVNSGLPIIELDETFFLYARNTPDTYYALNDGRNIIYIGTFSHFLPFSLPVSWVILPHSLISAASDIKSQQNLSSNIYAQALINETIKDGSLDEYSIRLRRHLRQREQFTLNILNEELGDMIDICSKKHPLSYWVRLPVSNYRLVTDPRAKNLVMGRTLLAPSDNHVLISKVNPSYELYAKSTRMLKNLILDLS